MVTVRLLPLPPKMMLPFGTSAGLEDWARKVKFVAGVAGSPIVKGIGPAGVSSNVMMLVMAERFGKAVELERMKTVKLVVVILLEAPPSLTVTVMIELPAPLFGGVK